MKKPSEIEISRIPIFIYILVSNKLILFSSNYYYVITLRYNVGYNYSYNLWILFSRSYKTVKFNQSITYIQPRTIVYMASKSICIATLELKIILSVNIKLNFNNAHRVQEIHSNASTHNQLPGIHLCVQLKTKSHSCQSILTTPRTHLKRK